jgi:hypothetical protein
MDAKILTVIFFLVFFLNLANAQVMTGAIDGWISDKEDNPIAGAEVIVESAALQGKRGAVSDQRGYFKFRYLPPGLYRLTVQHITYQTFIHDNITVRLGKTGSAGVIQLSLASIELPEVVVTEARPDIDPTTARSGSNLAIKTIEPLPVDRNYRSIIALVPRANTSYLGDDVNISGSTGLENEYFIDGVKATEPYLGEGSTNLPYNFIREIEVKTGGYEAEFRSALGGVVNVVTHSGGNRFQGQVFGFFTNHNLSQDRKLVPGEESVESYSQSDFGFSLGGPVLRDKLWFFAAYNPNFEKEDVTIPGFGLQTDRKTTHIFAGKLTWKANRRTNVIFSLLGDPRTHTRLGPGNPTLPLPAALENLDPVLGDWGGGNLNLSLRGDHVVNERFIIEAAVTYLNSEIKRLPATERGRGQPLFQDLQQNTWSGGYGPIRHIISDRTTASISAAFVLGQHTLKAGIEYENNRLNQKKWSTNLIFKINETRYQTFSNSFSGTAQIRTPSLYLQDSWLLSNRFRFNAGLRYDAQFISGSDGKSAQNITAMYQPRLGFIYQPGEVGIQKIFGSYGRFYEHPASFFAEKYIVGEVTSAVFDHDPRFDPTGGDTAAFSGPRPIHPEVKGLEGQHFDEFVLGYERNVLSGYKFGIRGIYRTLRQAIDVGYVNGRGFIMGNPGKGDLAFLEEFTRNYTALELTFEKFNSRNLNFQVSYVLSRNSGNYAGLFNSESRLPPFPHQYHTLDLPEQIPNSSGLLPNDRTHVLKFFGSYAFHFGLNVGTFFSWQSGTPLSEFGGTSYGPPLYSFISKRGAAGRMPSIWDLNLRFSYPLTRIFNNSQIRPVLLLDIFHIGSRREVVNIDQIHYLAIDGEGNQIGKNGTYLQPLAFQPPMSARLGIEINF